MATPDYGSMVLGGQDGGVYTGQHGLNKNSIINLIRQYGDPSALNPDTAASFGITGGDLAGVADNPYSTVKNIAKTLVSNNYGITNNANAHHAEFSGAHQAQLLHERNAGDQRSYDAGQALTGAISGVQQNDLTSYGNAIKTIMGNYVAPPTADPTAIAAPAAPAAQPPQAAVLPTAAQIPGATPGSQNWNDNPGGYNPQAPQNNPVKVSLPKPPKIPVGIHAQ